MTQLHVVGTLRSREDQPSSQLPESLTTQTEVEKNESGFCSLVADVLHCRRCSLMIADANGTMTVVDGVGLPATIAAGTGLSSPPGVAAEVARTGVARIVNDHPRMPGSPSSLGTYLSPSFMSYPFGLLYGAIGVINATERSTAEPFGSLELDLVRQLGDFYAKFVYPVASLNTDGTVVDYRSVRLREVQAQEEERQRIARDLHDDAGHRIMSAMLRLDMARMRYTDEAEIRSDLDTVRELLQECADGLHEVSFKLRPQILTDLGLAPALRSLARRTQESSGVRIHFYCGEVAPRFTERTELTAYRIAQEALTNAIKYADANLITITLMQTGACLNLTIADEGLGFDPELIDESTKAHLGLRGMRERADMIGGTVDVQSTLGLGTSVRAQLPVCEVTS